MLGGRLLGQYNGVTTQFYLTDALGSVVSTFEDTAGSAVILGNQAYGPYGNKIYSAGSMGTNKGYTGQYQDVTGLDCYNARYYDSVIGRFVSADSVQGNAQGMDPYDYVGGNPETMTDPTGQHWVTTDNGGDNVVHNEPFDPRPTGQPQPTNNPGPGYCTYYACYNGYGYFLYWRSFSNNEPAKPKTQEPPTTKPKTPAKPKPQVISQAAGGLTPDLIKLAVKLMQGNKRLSTNFDSADWTLDHIEDGHNLTNPQGPYTYRWYFYMKDGTGSKVAMSFNFNPEPNAKDPWDAQHMKFSSKQPDPGKCGENGWMRNTDWADPGSSENPGDEADQSFFLQYFSDTTPVERAIDEGEGGE